MDKKPVRRRRLWCVALAAIACGGFALTTEEVQGLLPAAWADRVRLFWFWAGIEVAMWREWILLRLS